MDYVIMLDVSGEPDLTIPANRELKFLSMEYSLNDKMLTCSAPESRQTLKPFYDAQRGGDLTHTSQVSPYMYETSARHWLDQGISVLCLTLSSGLSATYSSALIAKAVLDEDYTDCCFIPVDSLGATGGLAVMAERALRNKAEGMSIEDNAADLQEVSHRLCHWFFVQDLQYLKRGGRISAATAIIGGALNIKPLLRVAPNGKLETIGKKRGNALAVKAVVEKLAENYDPASPDPIYITDADDEELSAQVEAEILKLFPDAPVRRVAMSPIVGAHTGPGALTLCHIAKNVQV